MDDAGLFRPPRSRVGEELPAQPCLAVDENVHQQCRQCRQRDHQRGQGGDLKHEIGAMVALRGRHQTYLSRTRSRSHMLTPLSANVPTNSSRPTAKIVLYSSVPRGASPRLTWTTYAVIVSIGTRGLMVSRGC